MENILKMLGVDGIATYPDGSMVSYKDGVGTPLTVKELEAVKLEITREQAVDELVAAKEAERLKILRDEVRILVSATTTPEEVRQVAERQRNERVK
jgi:hypothetical protein